MIWMGVTKGLAGIKFSGSPSRFGVNSATIVKVRNSRINPLRSLEV